MEHSEYSSIKDVLSDRGVPLFVCDSFYTRPFEGGVTRVHTQVVFQGIRSYSEFEMQDSAMLVYSLTRQVVVTVTDVLEESRTKPKTERIASYSPMAEFQVFGMKPGSREVLRQDIEFTHVLFKAY